MSGRMGRRFRQIPAHSAICRRKPRHDAWKASRASSGGNGLTACWAGCWALCLSCRSCGSPSVGAIKRSDWPRLLLLFLLGGLQGFIGWWMVASGLEVRDLRQPVPAGHSSGYRTAVAGGDTMDRAGISARRPIDAKRNVKRAARPPLPCWSISRCCWARWWRDCMPG